MLTKIGIIVSIVSKHARRPDYGQPPTPRHPQADRKSTRLNSSHSQISYAVFCLKKKNVITRCPYFPENFPPYALAGGGKTPSARPSPALASTHTALGCRARRSRSCPL